MKYIINNPEPKPGSQFLYDGPGGPKISLAEGPAKFKECIDHLNSIRTIPALELSDDLTVKVPKNVNKWTKREVFADLLGEKKANLAEHYVAYQFQFDIGSCDPEISAIMQIVDDNNTFKGSRRANILSRNASLVGISSHKMGKKNCVYMLFARRATSMSPQVQRRTTNNSNNSPMLLRRLSQ